MVVDDVSDDDEAVVSEPHVGETVNNKLLYLTDNFV